MPGPDFRLEDLPLKQILPTDHLFVKTNDGTCSRCREAIAEAEVPLILWSEKDPNYMWQFCTRCAFDPKSRRCRVCGCTETYACDAGCGWVTENLCSECLA